MRNKKFGEKLNLAKIVLQQLLRRGPLSRTEINKRCIMKCGTPSKCSSMFAYLVQNGYVEKTAQRHRAPYRITEKGRKFLEALE